MFIDEGVNVFVGLGEGSSFQLLREPQNSVFKQKEQFDPNFC